MLRDIHGGDIYRDGREIRLDFSVNTNPLGMPESVREAAKLAVDVSDHYPDPSCGELNERLAKQWGIRRDMIEYGNGADDLIYRIVHGLKPKRAVVMTPTFSEYMNALESEDCEIIEHSLDESRDFELNDTILEKLTDDVDMLFLCSPNNPTGRLIAPELLKRIVKACERGIYLVLDECFIELAENGEAHRLAPSDLHDHTIVLRAFTKTYAIPGLRLGYAVFGSKDAALSVLLAGQHWRISTVAQAAGIAALDEREYVQRARKLISEERIFLSGKLEKFGFKVFPSDANFILFRCEFPLDELLLNEGILIRSCANYSGLGDGYFRVAVRLHDENEALINTIEKVTKWQKT